MRNNFSFLIIIPLFLLVAEDVSPSITVTKDIGRTNNNLCIVSADDAGTAAAYGNRYLQDIFQVTNLSTVLIYWHSSDIGGDLSSAVRTDLFTSARNVGGLSYIYDRFARQTDDTPCGQLNTARISTPGPSFTYLQSLLAYDPTLQLLPNYMVLPGSGTIGKSNNTVESIRLISTLNSSFESVIHCKYLIEGSNEGYALRAFNISVRYGREGVRNDSSTATDVTNYDEALAGRRIFGRCGTPGLQHCNSTDFAMGLAPLWLNVSDTSEEWEDVSMASSALLALRQYATEGENVSSTAPWLITQPPAGYSEGSYWFLSTTSSPPTEGYLGNNVYRCSFEHSYGLPRWYEYSTKNTNETNGTVVHYLRVPGNPYPVKFNTELRSLAYAIGALYYMQQKRIGGERWGLDNTSFTLPDRPGCFNLSHLQTLTYGGWAYEQISCRLYKRVNTRLNSTNSPVGGQAMLPRPLFQAPSAPIFRTYWEPLAIGAPLYPVDYRGVLADTVPMPDYAGPEGLVSLVYAHIGGTDSHGLHPRLLYPEYTVDNNIPPLNILSPGAPKTTFQAQAAVRIHATASNLGLSSMAIIAAAENMGTNNLSNISIPLAQWIMVSRLSGVINFQDAGMAGMPSYILSQLPGVYGIPPGQITGSTWANPFPTHADLYLWLSMYTLGLFNHSIPRWPPFPTVPSPFPFYPNVSLPFPSNSSTYLTRQDMYEVLEAIAPGSAAPVLTLPLTDSSIVCHLRDIRAIFSRHILYMHGVLGLPPYANLSTYTFPTYYYLDSLNFDSGVPANQPEYPFDQPDTCTTSDGLIVNGGVLYRNDNANPPDNIRTRLCTLNNFSNSGNIPAFRFSAEMSMEQTPVDIPFTSSVINSGLIFLYGSNATNDHGFFGLLNDSNATQFDAFTNQSLLFGLRLPPPYGNGTLLTTALPWPMGSIASFYLEIVHDGTGRYTGYVNNALALSGQVAVPSHPQTTMDNNKTVLYYNQFGVRVGEGSGRCLYQQIVLTEGTTSHRGF